MQIRPQMDRAAHSAGDSIGPQREICRVQNGGQSLANLAASGGQDQRQPLGRLRLRQIANQRRDLHRKEVGLTNEIGDKTVNRER